MRMGKTKNITKDEFIQVRVANAEKRKIEKAAKKSGFDSISAYILWLCRRSDTKKG